MGRNKNLKHSVKQNIFKVAGARSLKAKNKAKSVTSHIKLSNVKKETIEQIDKELVNLSEEIRNTTVKPIKELTKIKSTKEEIEKHLKFENTCEITLERLNEMKA